MGNKFLLTLHVTCFNAKKRRSMLLIESGCYTFATPLSSSAIHTVLCHTYSPLPYIQSSAIHTVLCHTYIPLQIFCSNNISLLSLKLKERVLQRTLKQSGQEYRRTPRLSSQVLLTYNCWKSHVCDGRLQNSEYCNRSFPLCH